MPVINITKNISGRDLYPHAKILVDEDVARKIIDQKIVLGIVPSTGSIIILKRNGKTANKNNGGRSFAKLITGFSRVQRHAGADVTDYRRTSFKSKKLPVSSSLPSKSYVDKTLQGTKSVQVTKPKSVIELYKTKMFGPIVASTPQAPISKLGKQKPRGRQYTKKPTPTLIRVASLASRLGPKELRLEFPDGSAVIGTRESIMNALKSWK